MKSLLFGLLVTVAIFSNFAKAASVLSCANYYSDNIAFLVTGQDGCGYFECFDAFTGKRYLLKFDGIGLLNYSGEGFLLTQPTPFVDPTGNYVGIRLAASAGINVNSLVLLGAGGPVFSIGLGYGIGVDPALVRVQIVRHEEDFN